MIFCCPPHPHPHILPALAHFEPIFAAEEASSLVMLSTEKVLCPVYIELSKCAQEDKVRLVFKDEWKNVHLFCS